MVQVNLKIDGMACGMCEAHINDAIRSHFTVKKVSSSHTRGETTIVCEAPPEEQKLREVIAETGYTLLGMEVKPCEEKHGLGGLFRHHG